MSATVAEKYIKNYKKIGFKMFVYFGLYSIRNGDNLSIFVMIYAETV